MRRLASPDERPDDVTGLAASRSLNVMADHPVAPSRATSRTRLPSGPLTTSDAGRDGDAGSRASDQRPRADVPNGNAETSRRPFTSVTMRCPPPPRGANAAAPETDKRSSPVRYAFPYGLNSVAVPSCRTPHARPPL